MDNKCKSILMVGPRVHDPKESGGMLVFFENILEVLDKQSVKYGVVDTNTQTHKSSTKTLIFVLVDFFRKFRQHDHINLFATKNHLIYLGPIFVFFGKLFGKTVCIHKTAGRFHREYEQLDFIRQTMVRYALRNSDFVCFETKFLVEYFRSFTQKIIWHPNIRKKPDFDYKPKHFSKRFAFISLVRKEKGIDELLEVSNMLDDSYTVDIYGPIYDEKYNEAHFKRYKANYMGALSPSEVLEKLQMYDVIVLPSYEEGYPGIFIEAFSYGVPVLTTTLAPILEIVEEGVNGILVEPRSAKSLHDGFLRFTDENYANLSQNAYKSFDMFDAEAQVKKVVEIIHEIK